MSWYAKPRGAYYYNGTEGKSNILEIGSYLSTNNYTVEAQSGVIGNVMAESGLNPWRWQSDSVSLTGGYGLFQYTPASGYINLSGIPNHSPNMSTNQQTSGATPEDAEGQLYVFVNNTLGKWVSTCWRSYWDTTSYATLYQQRQRILTEYGDGSRISMTQFARINNVWDATFVFLACFEGPLVPNMSARFGNAQQAYEILTGSPIPPTPPPGPSYSSKLKIWMMIKQF